VQRYSYVLESAGETCRVEPGENLDVALGVAMAVLPDVWLLSLVWLAGLYALAVGVALIVLALRLRGLRRGEDCRVT
jgi:Flp pilus assembly protein TadB